MNKPTYNPPCPMLPGVAPQKIYTPQELALFKAAAIACGAEDRKIIVLGLAPNSVTGFASNEFDIYVMGRVNSPDYYKGLHVITVERTWHDAMVADKLKDNVEILGRAAHLLNQLYLKKLAELGQKPLELISVSKPNGPLIMVDENY